MVWSPQLNHVAREGGADRYELGHELVDAFLEFRVREGPAEHGARLRARSEGVLHRRRQRPGRRHTGGRDGLRHRATTATARCGERRALPRRGIRAGAGDGHAPSRGGLCLLRVSVGPRRHHGRFEPGASRPADSAHPPRASGCTLGARSAPAASDPRPRGRSCPPCGAAHRPRSGHGQAMLLGGLRRCEALGLRLEDIRLGECQSSSPRARVATSA